MQIKVFLRRMQRIFRPQAKRGQILLEILIAVAVVATLSATIATLIIVAQRGQENARRRDIAANLASEVFAAVSSMVQGDIANVGQGYNRIYCPPGSADSCTTYPVDSGKDPVDRYHPVLVGNHWELATDEEVRTVDGIDFTSGVSIENVCRYPETYFDSMLRGQIAGTWIAAVGDCSTWYGGAVDDPYTQKLSATFVAPQMAEFDVGKFVTRTRPVVTVQSSWSGVVIDDQSGDGVITFTVNWGNDDDEDPATHEPVKIFLCKSAIQPLTFECPAGSWTETSTFTSNRPETLTYSPGPPDVGVNEFWVYVCDGLGQCSNSDTDPDPTNWVNYGFFTVS